nr:uncharacterized protein LOC116767872 [Danaus plexippus plexippus]
MPDVDPGEVEVALRQLKNNKAPGDDGITIKLLKAGGTPVLKKLASLLISIIHQGLTAQAWSRGAVFLFFKKGDKTLLKNYRPISLLSHIYKLFSRVVTNHLTRKLDEFQPPEQAGFRKGFITVDHVHTVRQIVQKTEEYNQPLCLAFVDYEKAFDSIEHWLQDHKTNPIELRRGVRQGDVISPKLFTNALEDVFKTLDCAGQGINVNGRNNFEREVDRRDQLGWAAFSKLRRVFSFPLPQCLKTKVYNQCVLAIMTYGAEMWTLTVGLVHRFKVAQRAMERAMLGVFLKDKVRNEVIRQKTKADRPMSRGTKALLRSAQRASAVMVIREYRTVSWAAATALAGDPPWDLVASVLAEVFAYVSGRRALGENPSSEKILAVGWQGESRLMR